MKNKVLLGVALFSLIPFSASANTCEPHSLGGYTIGTSSPISELKVMGCDKYIGSKCIAKKKVFQENGLHYVTYFRLSDGLVYEITAEKRKPTSDDYQYFLGLMKNDHGVPAAEGDLEYYQRTSKSNGIFNTKSKTRHSPKSMSFACWGKCETKLLDLKSKKRTGSHKYAPQAHTTYIKGTQLVKSDGLTITFSQKHRKKSELFIKASCEEIKSQLGGVSEKSDRTGRY